MVAEMTLSAGLSGEYVQVSEQPALSGYECRIDPGPKTGTDPPRANPQVTAVPDSSQAGDSVGSSETFSHTRARTRTPPAQVGKVLGEPALPALSAVTGHPRDCPECRNGAHCTCTGWALDPDTDELTECECAQGGHA